MSRLATRLSNLRRRGQKAMGLFLTSGFPSRDETLPILEILGEAADFIELGMPFSDPLAEGLPIQRSSARALAGGVRMEDTLRYAHAFSQRGSAPIVLMGYINPILRYGPREFCQAASAAGVDGLIIPDLPPEESTILTEPAMEAGLHLIYLVAPNTPDERVGAIDARSSGFVYAVSVTGVTGSGLANRMQAIESYLQRAQRLVNKNPLLVGFGIKSHTDAVRLCRYADGFIVGSALVDMIERLWDDRALSPEVRRQRLRDFVMGLKHGTP